MTAEIEKTPLLGLSPDELKPIVAEAGLRPFAAGQIARRIYQGRVASIDEITELPKAARAWLDERYCVGLTAPVREARSADGTVKVLFPARTSGLSYIVPGTGGGMDVESVFIPDRDRATLCVSSQAGCRMGCRFCATGAQGYHGQLTAAGILNQVFSVPGSERLTNIVFMGMGEPMDNVNEVIRAIGALTSPWGLAWSPRRITVSSIGHMAGLKRLLDETDVHVAISVHTPFASEREGIMPVEKAFPLADVVAMLRGYDFAHQRRLSAEYIMWRGVNDTMRHADALARLLRGTSCRVNLIRFHSIPTFEGEPSDAATMERFRDRLNSLGVTATIRASRGEDIDAACGMLAGKERGKL